MKASHLSPRVDNPHPDSVLLPPTPTSLYNYQVSPATPDLPPPLPPPHVNLSASQQESWNRLNSNSNAHKVYHSPSNSYRIEKSHYPDFRLPPPSPVRSGQAPSRGQNQQGWEQQYGLYTPLTTQQHNGHRQSAPSNYFPRQQYEVRGSLPSERYDRRSLVVPGDRQPQLPKTRSQPYIAPQYDRYHNDPQRSSLPNSLRSHPIANVPELKHSEAFDIKRDHSQHSVDQTQVLISVQPNNQENTSPPPPLPPPHVHAISEEQAASSLEVLNLAQRSQSISYGTMFNQTKQDRERHKEHELYISKGTPLVYPALLSLVAQEFKRQIEIGTRIKDGVEYKSVFDGRQAVSKLALIICSNNRQQALRLGRALGAQKLFNDVSYEHRLLDSESEIYQFHDNVLHINSYRTDDPEISDKEEIVDEKYEESEASFEEQQEPQLTGVYTELTSCYSPTCSGNKPCYSRSCPKRFAQHLVEESQSKSALGRSVSASLTHTPQPQELWVNQVSSFIIDSLTKKDRKRQENIFELIYTEKNFVNDIEYLYQMWMVPLLTTEVIPSSRRMNFVQSVFSNITMIYEVNSKLLSALQRRQSEHPVVSHIGDVMLDHVVNFEPFVEYGARQYGGKMAFERERATNHEFDAFVKEVERKPESRKLEINGYLTKPTTRLGRYNLLLGEILKHTPEGHSDCELIRKAMDTITGYLRRLNNESGNAKNKFDLQQLHDNLSFKNKSDEMDLDLLAEERIIIKQGPLKKTAALDSSDYQLILLDNYLLITKHKVLSFEEHYTIQRRPIPLELLVVGVPEQLRIRRASSILPYARPGTNIQHNMTYTATSRPLAGDLNGSNGWVGSKGGYPISFHHLGRKGSGHFTLYAATLAARRPWIDKIEKQQRALTKNRQIFELVTICDRLFSLTNRVNHTISFDNGRYFLLAADQGVYLGRTGDIAPPRRILHLDHCTQIQVIEETFTLLVVADRVLWEFPFDILHTKTGEKPDAGRKLRQHTPFIFVGECLNKKLICIPKSSSLNSYVSTYEPTLLGDTKKKTAFGRKKAYNEIGLKFFKEIYIPGEAWSVDLSATKMFITCQRGVQLVDMRTTNTQALLDPNDPDLGFIIDREMPDSVLNIRQGVKHICTYRIEANEHLVCYDEYAFYIDGKGRRKRSSFLIEWECQPDSFAFSYPYVLAFEPNFIEIRHMLTGALEQIISGIDIQSLSPTLKNGTIRGAMTDATNDVYQVLFELKCLVQPQPKPAPSHLHTLAYRHQNHSSEHQPTHHTWHPSRNTHM